MGAPAHYLADRARARGASEGYSMAVQEIGNRVRGYAYVLLEKDKDSPFGKEFLILADVIQEKHDSSPISRQSFFFKGTSTRFIEVKGDKKEYREVRNGKPLRWRTSKVGCYLDEEVAAIEKKWRKEGFVESWTLNCWGGYE